MNTQEIWKPIAECNGEYLVSNHGRVKSLKFGKQRILKPFLNTNGYPVVGFYINNKHIYQTVHKLVSKSFIQNPQNKLEINHKNGIKTDNNVQNLEWVTRKENIQHAWSLGLCENTRIAVSIDRSKPVIDLQTRIEYKSLSEACRILGLNRCTCASQIFRKSDTQRFEYIKL